MNIKQIEPTVCFSSNNDKITTWKNTKKWCETINVIKI